jgi:hypothetical protein
MDCGDAPGLARLFTPDGAYFSIRQAEGADNLASLFAELFADRSRPNKALKNGIHLCGMPLVDGDADKAVGLCHFAWISMSAKAPAIPIGQPYQVRMGFENGQPAVLLAGMYQDEYRKIAGRWLFKTRRALQDLPPAEAIPGPR